jgi:hypothetical protein
VAWERSLESLAEGALGALNKRRGEALPQGIRINYIDVCGGHIDHSPTFTHPIDCPESNNLG